MLSNVIIIQQLKKKLRLRKDNMFNIIFSTKKKRISVKNDFLSKAISLLEIIQIVLVLSQVKLRVPERQSIGIL